MRTKKEYQEALDSISDIRDFYINEILRRSVFDVHNPKLEYAIDKLQELIDNYKIVKPKTISFDCYFVDEETSEQKEMCIGECECGHRVFSHEDRHCGGCGKKLDWSDNYKENE